MTPLVEKIEEEVAALSDDELRSFRSWFVEFDAANWDRQFASDATNGRLDELAAEALAHYGSGKAKPL